MFEVNNVRFKHVCTIHLPHMYMVLLAPTNYLFIAMSEDACFFLKLDQRAGDISLICSLTVLHLYYFISQYDTLSFFPMAV